VSLSLAPVETSEQRESARALLVEYLRWVGDIARSSYGLTFDIEAMARSDIEDRAKFYPPTGRFYLGRHAGRGIGAGRALVQRLLRDAKELGYAKVRLESLRALAPAHTLYRSVGFVEVEAYADNSMDAYQDPAALEAYRRSAIFMELSL
jgi:GNAT superfamily N-acetyltransferase